MNQSTLDVRNAPIKIRRITDVLTYHWDEIRGDKPFPSIDDLNADMLADVWSNCFIVQLKHIKNKENYSFAYFGEALQRAFATDLTDTPVKYLISPHADHLASQYEKVLQSQAPLTDCSVFENRDHIKIYYRQVLLPLASDENENEVGFILGGMRYKLKP